MYISSTKLLHRFSIHILALILIFIFFIIARDRDNYIINTLRTRMEDRERTPDTINNKRTVKKRSLVTKRHYKIARYNHHNHLNPGKRKEKLKQINSPIQPTASFFFTRKGRRRRLPNPLSSSWPSTRPSPS